VRQVLWKAPSPGSASGAS